MGLVLLRRFTVVVLVWLLIGRMTRLCGWIVGRRRGRLRVFIGMLRLSVCRRRVRLTPWRLFVRPLLMLVTLGRFVSRRGRLIVLTCSLLFITFILLLLRRIRWWDNCLSLSVRMARVKIRIVLRRLITVFARVLTFWLVYTVNRRFTRRGGRRKMG